MKTNLTGDEYLKLTGLFELAVSHYKKMRDIERVIAEHLEVEFNGGEHIFDEIYSDSDHNMNRALESMKISFDYPLARP